MNGLARARGLLRDILEVLRLPTISIDLMHRFTRENDPFYARVVHSFFREARERHAKFPLVRTMTVGVAVCRLPSSFEEYLTRLEPSARRNQRKAERGGYRFQRIELNDFLEDVREIRRSTEVRQGRVAEDLLHAEVRPSANPPSRTPYQDYPYFGVVKEGKLYAYAGCLVSGELCLIEHILGHAAHQQEGIVPQLIIGMARCVLANHPQVRFYAYGTYYGAGGTMRRFKRKFGFLPHRVRWILGSEPDAHPALGA